MKRNVRDLIRLSTSACSAWERVVSGVQYLYGESYILDAAYVSNDDWLTLVIEDRVEMKVPPAHWLWKLTLKEGV